MWKWCFQGREEGDRGLQLLFNFRNCTYLNPMSQSRGQLLSAVLLWISRAYATLWPHVRLSFPRSRVLLEPVEKKELRRGGSQLKRISAPAVRSRRAIFESPHHLDILNATPFPLHRSATPLSTRTRCLFNTRFVFPSFCPRQRNLPSLFHAEEIVHRSTKDEGVYCLLETCLSSRYSR